MENKEENNLNNNGKIKKNEENSMKLNILLGFFIFFIVSSTAILHANEKEFILDRFIGLNEATASYYDTVLYIAFLIGGIILSFLSDKTGRRKEFIIIGCLGGIISFWFLTVAPTYESLLLIRFIQGLFTILSWQSIMTLTLDISNTKNRGKNMAIFGIFLMLAMGLGSMFGGIMSERGLFVPYYFSMIFNGIVLILTLIFLKNPEEIEKRPSLKSSLSILNRTPKLIVPSIFNFIDRLHMGFIIFIIPFYLQEIWGFNPQLRGMILALNTLPVLFLQYPVGKYSDNHSRLKPLIIGSLGYGIVLSITGYIGIISFELFLFMMVVLGIFSGFSMAPAMALVGDMSSSEDNAMAMGVFNFFGNFGIIIGPLLGGYMIVSSGYPITFLVAGLIELIAFGICVLLYRLLSRNE